MAENNCFSEPKWSQKSDTFIHCIYQALISRGFDSHEMAFFQRLTKAQSLPLNYSVVLNSDVETTESFEAFVTFDGRPFHTVGTISFPLSLHVKLHTHKNAPLKNFSRMYRLLS